MSSRFNDCASEFLWVFRCENTRTNEYAVCTKMHHQSCVGWCSYSACCEVNDWKLASLMNAKEQVISYAEDFSLMVKLVLRQTLDFANLAVNQAKVTNRFNDVTRSWLTLCTKHCCSFLNTTQCFTKIFSSAYEWNCKFMLANVEYFISWCKHFALVDIINAHGFEHFRFNIMTDTSFRHYWNRYNF